MASFTMNEVLKGLYMGNLYDSRNPEALEGNSITHILSIYDMARPHFQGSYNYLCVDVSDSSSQPITQVFGECIEFIHRARADGGRVLVHCLAGVSRSATVICAYILARTNLKSEQSIFVVQAARRCANPNYGFKRQLQDWSKTDCSKWRELLATWPQVRHDDKKRCSKLLALYKSQVGGKKTKTPTESSEPTPSVDSTPATTPGCENNLESGRLKSDKTEESQDKSHPSQSIASSGSINSALSAEEISTTSPSTGDSSEVEKPHIPIIMGNSGSSSYVYELPTGDNQTTNPPAKKSESSRMNKVRTSIRNALNRRSNKDITDKKKKDDKTNNNNNGISKLSPDDPSYYTENITRSATLPSNYGKQLSNGDSSISYNTRSSSGTIHARLLPAYKSEEQPRTGIIGNIQNRQRIMSSPSYTRTRTNSQSSSYSQRYSSINRATTTHIPAHIDKRLVRSRSVGVIPATEMKMRKTASASVVKLDDVEDWIV